MAVTTKPLQVFFHHDVLCAWSYVADARLETLRAEFEGVVRFRFRPFPTRVQDSVLTLREVDKAVRSVQRASEEPEGGRLTTELWRGPDAPRSSVPALLALEAARLQGADEHHALLRAMQRTALESGVNVARSDVAFELAQRVGLKMARFAAAFNSAETRRLVLEEHRMASDRGIREVPSLVIGGRWLLAGLHDVSEYRSKILTCLARASTPHVGPSDGTLH